ncbi:MAG: hypothetical protein HYZ39_02415 [Mycolicibacterium cosmeticum]|nr:hypothetical protein [Mycolicibacterium cosmeticum]
MEKSVSAASRFTVLVVAFTSVMVALSGGIAHADYVGQTFADASAYAAKHNQSVTVATIVGDVLDRDECIVVSAQKVPPVGNDNFEHRSGMLFGLNCGAKLASRGLPGNSAMSPTGQIEKKNEATVKRINESTSTSNGEPTWCSNNIDRCKTLCDQTGLCSDETLAVFG